MLQKTPYYVACGEHYSSKVISTVNKLFIDFMPLSRARTSIRRSNKHVIEAKFHKWHITLNFFQLSLFGDKTVFIFYVSITLFFRGKYHKELFWLFYCIWDIKMKTDNFDYIVGTRTLFGDMTFICYLIDIIFIILENFHSFLSKCFDGNQSVER